MCGISPLSFARGLAIIRLERCLLRRLWRY